MDYLHRCLDLHGQVTKLRYGRVQRLDAVERCVQDILASDGDLWDVIRGIHGHAEFGADMFGFLPAQIERELRESAWHEGWRTLPKEKLVAGLYRTFRQIEPASMVLRFFDPKCYGIMSSPVASILGVRSKRKPEVAYSAYLHSLEEIREKRGFGRVADVEMALWVLQVGVLQDGRLPPEDRDALKRDYDSDTELRQLATRNLTVQLFSENPKLDVAEALLSTKVDVAGQIAGIEFERLVGERVGVRKGRGAQQSLEALIKRLSGDERLRNRCDHARRIRNRAIHEPRSVTRKDVEFLIAVAREIET